MTGRRRLPVPLWVVMLILVVAGDGLLLAHQMRSPGTLSPIWPAATLDGLAFGSVGVVVATRRAENPIGWLFLTIGVLSGVQLLTGEYAMYDRYVLHDSLPGASVSGWVSGLVSVAVLGLLPLVLLVFPDGRFLSHGWRRFGKVAVLLSAASALWVALTPGELGLSPGIDNPFGVESDNAVLRVVAGATFELTVGAPIFVCLMAGVVSLVLRWRSSGPEQRAQLKWVLFAATAGFSAILLTALLIPVAGEWLNNAVWSVALAVTPVAVGVSILRYHLFSIDHIISRTVSYTVITGLLVVVYAGLVTAVSRLTPTGGSWAVAGATLAVASLFQPLRRRVQAVVDRRFNRPRVDAAATIEAFGLQLRDQVDLAALAADLLAVVRQTMEPASASLWLRAAGGTAGETSGSKQSGSR
jgi:hypothetical protein